MLWRFRYSIESGELVQRAAWPFVDHGSDDPVVAGRDQPDTAWALRTNSPDSMLYLNRHNIDWATGKVERQETVFLHDPDRKVPFRIVHEDTASRYSPAPTRHEASASRRHFLVRPTSSALHPEGRPQRQGTGNVRDHG